jgi:hypothetical protein
MKRSFRIIGGFVLLSLIIIGSIFILQISNPYNITGTDVVFEEIGQGSHCDLTARITYVINENESWYDLWISMHNRSSSIPKLPTFNFTTDLIIAVFQGDCPTTGYMTTISKIILTMDCYVVYVDEICPGPSCITFQAFTQPCQISGYPLDLPAQFVYNITTYECV